MLAGIWAVLGCGMLAGTVNFGLSADEHSEFDKGKAESSQCIGYISMSCLES